MQLSRVNQSVGKKFNEAIKFILVLHFVYQTKMLQLQMLQ